LESRVFFNTNEETMSYIDDAKSDAEDTILNFEDEIVEQLHSDGKASDDLFNDYPNGDAYHHESHVDKWYDLDDAAKVISELDDYEETDSGLWEGCDIKDALAACAAYTYGNAVYHLFQEQIGELNDSYQSWIDDQEDFEPTLEQVKEWFDAERVVDTGA
jgi:hypothetical protein